MPELIAVTGATGAVGGRVARRLAALGAHQRLVVRDPARAPGIEDAEVRQTPGYHDAEATAAALDGVHTLFLVPAAESERRVEEHYAAVDAAARAGVQRIVYLSFVNARPDSVFTLARHHALTEERIRGTGIPHTFVRMSLYMDFIPNFAGPDDVIRGPAGDGRIGAILRDDVADAVVAVLAGGDHDGRTYDVTGPEAFTLEDAARQLAIATGRPIRYQNETVEEAYASRAGYGAPDWEVEGWVTTYTAIAAGEVALVTDTVEQLTGHPPVGLAEWLSLRSTG
jgi:NAD(P)H dehydrogenase (quinone)